MKDSKYRIILAIISHKGNLDRVEAIKQTWLKSFNSESVLIAFVYGCDGANVPRMEGGQVFLDVRDSWGNLPKKIYHTLKFFYTNYHFDYLIKCDDDNLVDLGALIASLKHKIDYAGKMYKTIFDSQAERHQRRTIHQKRFPDLAPYKGKFPKMFALGPLYVLSRRAVQCFLIKEFDQYEDCSLEFGLEDIMLGKAIENISDFKPIIFDWKNSRSAPWYVTNLSANQIRSWFKRAQILRFYFKLPYLFRRVFSLISKGKWPTC